MRVIVLKQCVYSINSLPVQLCKSIVLENTQLPADVPDFGSDPHASRYVCVIVQYATRLNTDKLRRHLHRAHKAAGGAAARQKLQPAPLPRGGAQHIAMPATPCLKVETGDW